MSGYHTADLGPRRQQLSKVASNSGRPIKRNWNVDSHAVRTACSHAKLTNHTDIWTCLYYLEDVHQGFFLVFFQNPAINIQCARSQTHVRANLDVIWHTEIKFWIQFICWSLFDSHEERHDYEMGRMMLFSKLVILCIGWNRIGLC